MVERHEDLEVEEYILVRDSNGKLFERLEGNKHWWNIGSLSARKTSDISLPATIVLRG